MATAEAVQPISPPSAAAPLPPLPLNLDLRSAEKYALEHQPVLAASLLRAQAETQRVYEARSQFFPQIFAYSVAVKAKDDNSRLAANSGLSNPTIISRQSDGGMFSQLITDFGRTYFLTTSARANALSAAQRAEVTREQLLFRVDQAFYAAEGAQSLLWVANQTTSTNQVLVDRARALAASSLTSTLDVSFAEVALAQAKLLQIQARARVQETLAELSASLGIGRKIDFVLQPQDLGPAIPTDVAPLITEAWAHRPDLAAARDDRDAALRFAKAEGAARLPTVSAQGGMGVTPERVAGSLPNNYGSVGVNVSVPIFTGGLLTARSREAALRAQAAQKLLEDQETEAARDVYDAWYDAKTAFEAIAVTQQLLASSQQAFELAQARYQTGASSIVELSQADLQLVQAKIAAATSRYDYQVRRRALDFQMGTLK